MMWGGRGGQEKGLGIDGSEYIWILFGSGARCGSRQIRFGSTSLGEGGGGATFRSLVIFI